MTGIQEIEAERARQILAEGYDAAHDDTHLRQELAWAACAYIFAAHGAPSMVTQAREEFWPPDWGEFKPALMKDASFNAGIGNLARAGALIAAEIDRRKRLEARGPMTVECRECGARMALKKEAIDAHLLSHGADITQNICLARCFKLLDAQEVEIAPVKSAG
jgi:hypothetical protein